jgi:cell division protein FtsW
MLAAGLFALFALIKLAPYRMNRWLVFLNPETDPLGRGYQIKQSLIAVGSGGIFGLGLGMSGQKFGFLPQSMTDSAFAIFAEETGFFGALILISLLAIILWQGFRISIRAKDNFLKLLGFGITSWICLQAFANIAAMIGVLPLAGIPLPFISYGGSHVVAELAGMGILLNISKRI